MFRWGFVAVNPMYVLLVLVELCNTTIVIHNKQLQLQCLKLYITLYSYSTTQMCCVENIPVCSVCFSSSTRLSLCSGEKSWPWGSCPCPSELWETDSMQKMMMQLCCFLLCCLQKRIASPKLPSLTHWETFIYCMFIAQHVTTVQTGALKRLKLLFAVCSIWRYDLPALPHAYVHTFYPFMGLRGKPMTGSSAAKYPLAYHQKWH